MVRAFVIALAAVLCAGIAAAGGTGSNQIKEIKVSQTANRTTVTVVGTSRPTYTAFKLSTPKRLVVDLANSSLKGVPSVVDAVTPLIDGVAVSEFSTGGVSVARVMVNFKKEAGYRVKVRGNDLVITMTGGPAEKETASDKAVPDPKAEKEIAAAKAEAEQARAEAKAARTEAENAQARWAQAEARASEAESRRAKTAQELAEIKKLSVRHESEAEKARKEAAEAQAALESAMVERSSSEDEQSRKLALAERAAKKKISQLEEEMATAREAAAREKARRESVENRLEELNNDLEEVRIARLAAESIKEAAVASAQSLKEDARKTTVEASDARKEARQALQAQKEAARKYEEAAKEERSQLLTELRQRERETVEAKRRLAQAEASKTGVEKKLTVALADLKEASSTLKKVSAEQKAMEARAAREVAQAEKKRRQAEQSMEKALEKAELASKARLKAESEMAKIRKRAMLDSSEAQRKAEASIAKAEQRVAVARKAQKEATERAKEFQKQIARAEAAAQDANQRAQVARGEIALARERASKAEKKATLSDKELAAARQQIKGHEEKYAQAEEKLSMAEGRIEQQQKRIDELEASKKAVAKQEVEEQAPTKSGKLTQEELRLQRLARMAEAKGDGAEPEPVAKKTSSAPKITNIEFVNRDGEQKIVITSDRPLSYRQARDGKRGKTLVFEGAELGPMLERTLDVSDFGGAVERISSYREEGGVKLDVDCADLASNSVTSDKNTLEWTFEVARTASTDKVKPLGSSTRTVIREDDSAYEYSVDRTAAYSVALKKYGPKKKSFTGRRIDLDFKDADIHNILRLLSDVGHVNIVTADDVSGTVTIRMRNVPWDQALDVILQAKKLGMVRDGNLIRVAPLVTLEKEREMEIARRQQNRALEPLETRLIPVSYAQAGELQPRAQDLLSERGKISVDSRTNVIIARDTISNLDQIEALIRNLDTQTPQVLIEGRIVEASSTYAREIGIQWGGDFSASSATANPTGLAFPSTVGVAGGATDNQAPVGGLSPVAGGRPNPNFAVNLPAAAGTGSGGALGITLGSIANNANLNLRLSAMEEEGTLRILSSPKILTLDNREAHIEQGTLIPYSRISAQGIQTSFKEAKLNLTVTPHVTADGSVLLNIMMTRDEPDFNNKGARGDPTILKREAQTELLVADGHTAVIGGIFTRNHGTSYKKVPFFGDIPILGWLFKNRSDSDRRSEMLIFITPRIVNRAESIGQ